MSDWLRADEAAVWLGVKVPTLHVIAHRKRWRKNGTGRDTRYRIDDVAEEAARREEKSQ